MGEESYRKIVHMNLYFPGMTIYSGVQLMRVHTKLIWEWQSEQIWIVGWDHLKVLINVVPLSNDIYAVPYLKQSERRGERTHNRL